MIGGIYTITNTVSGKIYVGSAKNFEDRWRSHLYDLRRNKHVNIHLQRAFNKDGELAFIFKQAIVLGEYIKQQYFDEENAFMEYLKAEGFILYNIAKAEGGWTFHDAESKQKIADKISNTINEMYAKLTPEERKAKWAYWSKENPLPQSARDKISKTMIGVKKTEETKARMLKAQNHPHLKDSKRELMREVGLKNKGRAPPNKGCKASEETKQKQREAKIGTKLSDEHKANIKKSSNIVNKVPVKINDIDFESKAAAAKHFNRSITWVTNRMEYD